MPSTQGVSIGHADDRQNLLDDRMPGGVRTNAAPSSCKVCCHVWYCCYRCSDHDCEYELYSYDYCYCTALAAASVTAIATDTAAAAAAAAAAATTTTTTTPARLLQRQYWK